MNWSSLFSLLHVMDREVSDDSDRWEMEEGADTSSISSIPYVTAISWLLQFTAFPRTRPRDGGKRDGRER